MESFSNDINLVLSELRESEKQADELIANFQNGFDKVIEKYIKARNNTPVKPNKKRPKNRGDVTDIQDDSLSNETCAPVVRNIVDDTLSDDTQPLRATRTGRAKAAKSYKEPLLNTKLRRDNDMVLQVRLERISASGATGGFVPSTAQMDGTMKIKQEKVNDSGKSTTRSTTRKPTGLAKSKQNQNDDELSDSLEIVTSDANPTIELSDEEEENDENKMPPPSMPPPKAKEKKAASRVTRATRSKQTRRRIKQEPKSDSDEEDTESVSSASTVRSSRATAAKAKTTRNVNTTAESLYEDAVSEPSKNATDFPSSQPSSQQSDATFVTTSGDTQDSAPLSPRGTYVIPKTGAGVNKAATVSAQASESRGFNNETVVAGPSRTVKAKGSTGSIMTEDDSDSDSTRKTYRPTNKKDPKELFNPCASKPIKQRVEAFEKLQTPQKDMHTKTRPITESEKIYKSQGSMRKGNTPSESAGRHLRTNSVTRYAQSAKLPLLTKSQSSDEIRKKTQAIADEKKKKQDEKLRKAQLAREAQEKEKLEKQRKLLMEKEQRAKEKALLKQQEEMLRLQEQKRKEAEREQKRKEAAKKAADDRREQERKEQEHLQRVMAEKRLMQEHLKMNKQKQVEERKKMGYNFDMLDSGDSTDEESKTSDKRPSPPSWSVSANRRAYIKAQIKVNSKTTDLFFSTAPHDVDLREIFPEIDERNLRRNSSAIWNSPPRYSTLPKY